MVSASASGTLFHAPMISIEPIAFIIITSISIYFVRQILNKFVYLPIARWSQMKEGTHKFLENVWYATYHPTQFSVGFYLMMNSNFFPLKYQNYWVPFPNYFDWTDAPILHWFYLFYMAFYLQGCVALFVFETRRKDFLELVIHHFVTIFLIALSYISGEHRIGLNVMVLHDLSDIFLYTAKSMHYLHKNGKKWRRFFKVTVDILFIIFASSFFLSRIYAYPLYIIYPAMVEVGFPFTSGDTGVLTISTVSGDHTAFAYLYDSARAFVDLSHNGFCLASHCISPHFFLVVLMMCLEALHIFWFLMILKMIRKQIRNSGTVGQDIRSDEEGESDDEEEVETWKKNK